MSHFIFTMLPYMKALLVLLLFGFGCTSPHSERPELKQDEFEVKRLTYDSALHKVRLSIRLNEQRSIFFEIYDVLGKALHGEYVLPQVGDTTIEYSTKLLPKGIYYTRVSTLLQKKMNVFRLE
jgi:hypothetical protein